jgi:FemAB-related protein (PEP-CTERM system-associated)
MTVIERFDGSADEWDTFVRSRAGWTHFHLYAWRGVMERSFGHETVYLCARQAGALTAVLPLVRVRSWLFGHYLVSMPFLNYGGPLGESDALTSLIEAAAHQAERERVGLLQLRCRQQQPTDLPASHQKLTVLLDIPSGGSDSLWKQLPHKMRTKIRKPQKAGVEVRFGLDQLECFYHILAQNMRDLGTPVQSRRFYEEIATTFADSVWFACAYFEGEAVSGGCAFVWGDEMEITWSSSLRQKSGERPGYLLHWSFLERAAQEGLKIANFGRSTPGSGTHEYKRQWGGRDEIQWWYFRSRSSRASTPTPDDERYAWGPAIWKRLPLTLTTKLGPTIVRYIP